MSKHWYRNSARDWDCIHKKPPTSLVNALADHTGNTREATVHIIDRLTHLATCLDELESITLFRLQQGKNQKRRISE